MTHLRRFVALSVVAALTLAGSAILGQDTASGEDHPRLRDAWFTKTVPVTGRDLRIGNLPSKQTEFDSSKDERVVFLALLNGIQGAKLRVVLKNSTGKTRTGNWTIPDLLGSGEWRFTTYRFAMADLKSSPGEYSADLFIDDKPAGTYRFTLK
jgi:hypothetical protein